MTARPYLIGIAGPTGSGKTLLSEALRKELIDATILRADEYRRGEDLSPDAIDHERLCRDLAALARGEVIRPPGASSDVHPHTFVIVEGLHLFHSDAIREILGLRVFVHADHSVCETRWIARLAREGEATRYENEVKPVCDQFVAPAIAFADVVFDGAKFLERNIRRLGSLIKEYRDSGWGQARTEPVRR
ncbi:MAG: hypothetical protein RL885_27425 [Planctomycetota bacterium]